ncbi:MAG: tyrosine-type recombinase/integrase [Desulfobaccales bacterium]
MLSNGRSKGSLLANLLLLFNQFTEAARPAGTIREPKCQYFLQVVKGGHAPGEINAFLAQVDEPKYQILFMLAVFSGARQGELLGLRWSDVDWEKCQLAIQRTFNNGALFTPNTQTPKRKIDFGPRIMEELKKWRIACPKNDLDLIFPNEARNHINNNNMLRRNFRPSLKVEDCPPRHPKGNASC